MVDALTRLETASLDEARQMLNNREITGDQLRAWFPRWCVGKADHRVNKEGVPEDFHYQKYHPDGGYWLPISWIISA